MKERNDSVFVADILDETQKIEEFIKGMENAEFVKNELVRHAVERSLEIIGEAAKGLSEEYRKKRPEIEWKKIIGLRNLLSHAYSRINADALWEVAKNDVPKLRESLSG